MILAESALLFMGAFTPQKFFGQRKFIAAKCKISLLKVNNISRDLQNLTHGRTVPYEQTLNDLPLLGINGVALKKAITNIMSRTRRVKKDDGSTGLIVSYPSREQFKDAYLIEKLPFTELDSDLFAKEVSEYVKVVDFAIADYFCSLRDHKGNSNAALSSVPIPENLLTMLSRVKSPDDWQNIASTNPDVITKWLLDFFIFYLAICEAGLPEHCQVVSKLNRERDGQYVMGFKDLLLSRLDGYGLGWADIISTMNYDQRRFYRHLDSAEALISPVFLYDFAKAYHQVMRKHVKKMPDDNDLTNQFMVFTFKRLYVLDRLSCDNPAGVVDGMNQPLHSKKEDFRESLSRFDIYVRFAVKTMAELAQRTDVTGNPA